MTVNSLQAGISLLKEEKVLVSEVDKSLTRFAALAEQTARVIELKPNALAEVVPPNIRYTVESLLEPFAVLDSKVQKLHGVASTGVKKTKQFARAISITKALLDILRTASRAEVALQIQLTQLWGAIKTEDLKDDFQSILQQHRSPVESFRSAFNTPAALRKARLDFELKDSEGRFATAEGQFRQFVLDSTDTKNGTVARGALCLVHGISGMAGGGKTTALIGRGHDSEVRAHFADGVLCMSLGAAAKEESVANELCKILELTGAMSGASAVAACSSLSEAVARTATWFLGRRILFLIDDIWPTPGQPRGYLPELVALLRGSPDSRIAFSTRSTAIAICTGSHEHFGA